MIYQYIQWKHYWNTIGTPKKKYIPTERRQRIIDELRVLKSYTNRVRMEYQKIVNLLNKANNQSPKIRTKNWVEVDNAAHLTNNTNSQIKFKTTQFKSSFCDQSDVHLIAKETKTITGAGAYAATRRSDERNKQATFKNYIPVTDCNMQVDN